MFNSKALKALFVAFLITMAAPISTLAYSGGDPGDMIYYPEEDSQLGSAAPALAIASTGVMFGGFTREVDTFEFEIVILRSEDGGQSWDEWSVINFPGDSAVGLKLQIATGASTEQLYMSFVKEDSYDRIQVYSTSATDLAPAWNQVQVEQVGGVAGVYPYAGYPQLATRSSTTGPPTVAVAYWVVTDYNDKELHYSVSLDGGATFQSPITLIAPAAQSVGSFSTEVKLGFGGGGAVTVVVLRSLGDTTPEWSKINLATAVNDGATLADWTWSPTLLLDENTSDYGDLTLASDPQGDDIVIAYRNTGYPNLGTQIQGSVDGGATWLDGEIDDPDIDRDFALFWTAWGPMATATGNFFGYHILRPSGSILGPYEAQRFLRVGWTEHYPAQIALDPTRGNQVALLAIVANQFDQEDALWFNAEWRDQPGYAVLQSDWLQSLPGSNSRYVAAPAVADLDGDGLAEIIVASNYELETVGPSYLPDYAMAYTGPVSVPALYDLDNDGHWEIAIGGTNGLLHVLDHEMQPIGGQPHDLGSGTDVFVSTGPVTGITSGEIVAATGQQIHLLNLMGSERAGWPVTAPIGTVVGRAAIGDVDGDGETEIVVPLTSGVVVLDSEGVMESFLLEAAASPSDAVVLADLDADGDLEIVVPMSSGHIELIHHDGTSFGLGWPLDSGTGSPVVGVTIAGVLTAIDPTICFSTESGSVFAVDINGTDLPNYPVSIAASDSANTEPIIARVAVPGTDQPQLLLGTTGGWLHEWTGQAEQPVDWPNYFSARALQSPVAADVDGDGSQELILIAGHIVYAFDTGTPVLSGPRRQWPMTGYDLARSGCLDCLPDTPTSVTDPEAPEFGGTERARIMFAGAFPNPAPGRTAFRFSLPSAAAAELAIYDVRGRQVRSFDRRSLQGGEHVLAWDGRNEKGINVASGLYIARLIVSEGSYHRVLTRELVVKR